MSSNVICEFQKIDSKQEFELGVITLNRPDKANALNEDMIKELHHALDLVKERKTCRLLILRGEGKHFCSGADLSWMKKSASMSYQDNILDAEHLAKVFEKLFEIPVVSLAIVQGASAGGGLGLMACCDLSIAVEDANFSLKEVRVGLLPAMILPYLMYRMDRTALTRLGLTGEIFSAEEAFRNGLITKLCSSHELSNVLRDMVQHLLEGGPNAQREFKTLLRTLSREKTPKMQLTCIEAIAKARTSDEGQKGLSAVLAKGKPFWAQKLSDDWNLR